MMMVNAFLHAFPGEMKIRNSFFLIKQRQIS